MKQLKHEAELVKAAILAGMKYGEERGAVVFEPTDSASESVMTMGTPPHCPGGSGRGANTTALERWKWRICPLGG